MSNAVEFDLTFEAQVCLLKAIYWFSEIDLSIVSERVTPKELLEVEGILKISCLYVELANRIHRRSLLIKSCSLDDAKLVVLQNLLKEMNCFYCCIVDVRADSTSPVLYASRVESGFLEYMKSTVVNLNDLFDEVKRFVSVKL